MTPPTVPPPPIEVRAARVAVIVTLILATIGAGGMLLRYKVLADNKTEVGMVLGWLIAKSGTVVDWLFGGSEGGSRRADATPHPGVTPTGTPGDPVTVTPETKGGEEAEATPPPAGDYKSYP